MIINSKTKIYLTEEENVYLENDFDVVIIGSKNNQHFQSLILANKYKKHIYCEKPIVSNLPDLYKLKDSFRDRIIESSLFFQTGLCLRYTKICEMALDSLNKIGKLKRIYGCEKLNIGHAAQSFMQCWRGLKSVSGGLGLEKCIHDYDLLLYFVEKGCGITISTIAITSIGKREFWLPERKKEITEKIENDTTLRKAYHSWDTALFHRLRDDPFKLYEENSRDCIPDTQNVYFEIMCTDGSFIRLDFDICAGEFRTRAERFYLFEGSNGTCRVDLGRNVIVNYDINFNLKEIVPVVNDSNDGHCGGDYFVMKTFVNLMIDKKADNIVTLQEALRATHVGYLVEKSLENNGDVQMYEAT
jgi:predicted dehydrogenase